MNAQQHKQELIKIHAGAVKVIASFKLTNLRPDISIALGRVTHRMIITVFDFNTDNESFYFYHDNSIEEIKVRLSVLVKTIKSDDFGKIKELAEL